MDKNAIKKFAVWARRELIEKVSQRALLFGIENKKPMDAEADTVNGNLLTASEKRQRKALIGHIHEHGYEQVMEEVAYTWFNRFCAIRFMEVNGYLPTHVRVFSDDEGAFKPQILTEAIHLDMDGLDMEKVYSLKQENQNEALFKYLLITQCNALSAILPGMFQRIEDYTELLLPDYLLREGSVVQHLVDDILEEDWTDQVQIIGWLYQYYNSEPKDKVFENLKKNIKISKENIPAATQLFTPDWIVRYMVENSLGRLWVEGHPNDELKSGWKYYLEEAEQEPEVQAQLATIRAGYAQLKPEDLLCIDPCMGSGHILCYMFDVLVQIYETYGYTSREAAVSIVEHNLWGLDIDDRAAQLAYFAVMMKARQYDRRFFTREVQPHVFAIQESNSINLSVLMMNDAEKKAAKLLVDAFHDAKEYGSILTMSDELLAVVDALPADAFAWEGTFFAHEGELLTQLCLQARALGQKYHAVITNPPYAAVSGLADKVGKFIKDNYPDSKADLFAVFIERIQEMLVANGYQAMITQHAWMFLSSFENLRKKMTQMDTVNMAHLGARAFDEIAGEVVQTTAFVTCNRFISEFKGTYLSMIEGKNEKEKEALFIAHHKMYCISQLHFCLIPGQPIAYWLPENKYEIFSRDSVGNHFDARVGLMTTDNDRFLRVFWEVDINRICFDAVDNETSKQSGKKWFPHNKGGSGRKWYGNQDYIVDWENNGERIKKTAIEKYPYLKGNPNFVVHDDGYYFRENISWSELGGWGFRFFDKGFTFNVKGMSAFAEIESDLLALLGYANTKVAAYFAKIINPSLSFGATSFNKLPWIAIPEQSSEFIGDCVRISRSDWDSFETSWDFQQHPLIATVSTPDATSLGAALQYFYGANPPKPRCKLELAYLIWQGQCNKRFNQLKANEEELNRIFIDIYGLQDELTPDVADKDVTVRRADLQRDIKSLISYAVGCMLGRYSLDKPGLNYAGGEWALDEAATYPADRDGILPITDDDYFDDDIVGMFVKFIETVYGKATLEENLRFIADALGGTGTSREVIRSYFLNEFYKDHCTTYSVTGSGKRPIYWLFDAGKKNSFKCLIYMHRYRKDTIARIRTDYVHETQSRYRTAIEDVEKRLAAASSASDRVKLNKQLKKLQEQAEELRKYEEKIHHLADMMIDIDLDDGVNVNYEKFKDVLAPIK